MSAYVCLSRHPLVRGAWLCRIVPRLMWGRLGEGVSLPFVVCSLGGVSSLLASFLKIRQQTHTQFLHTRRTLLIANVLPVKASQTADKRQPSSAVMSRGVKFAPRLPGRDRLQTKGFV